MLRASLFVGIILLGYTLAIARGPLYGLLAYAVVYFIPPSTNIHWWAEYIPFARLSLASSVVLVISLLLHRDKLIIRKFMSVKWLFGFTLLSIIISVTVAIDQQNSLRYSYKLITYCVIIWFILKVIANREQLKTILLTIIGLSGVLSLLAYFEGERHHGRLENIGANDAFEANEFALLLVGIIPLMLPFIFHGKKYEKLICIMLLPFIFNAVILCNSRGAIVALLAGMVYGVFIIADRSVRKKMLIVVVCAIPLFVYLTDPEFKERMSSLLKMEEIIQDEAAMSELSSGRTGVWKYGMLMVSDHPFGAGPNNFRYIARFYLPQELLTFKPGATYGVRAAHNSYLQVLVEQGYLGLFIWIMMCLHTILLLWRASRKLAQRGISNSFMGLTMFSMNISFVCSLSGGMFASRVYYEFFWWQVALSVVAYSFVLEMEQNWKRADAERVISTVAEGGETG